MTEIVPFGQTRSLMQTDPSAVAAAEAVKARIQAAYVMAMSRPRNEDQARSKILRMCEDPEFAERVEYSKPIGGKAVKGETIRFAEMAMAYYGNILTEVQLLYDDENIRRVRVSALDLESNVQFSRDITLGKTVERRNKKNREDDVLGERKNSYGDTVYILRATEDEMLTKESAMASKFIRTEGLRLIPAGIKKEAVARARETLAKRDKDDPNAAKKRILDAFTGLNIWPVDIEKLLGHKVDNITPAEIAHLRTIYTALESGEATWRDYIEPKENIPPNTGDQQPSKKPAQTSSKQTKPAETGTHPASEPESEPEAPKTNANFAKLIKEQTGADFEYVPTGDDRVANDPISAFLEMTADHQVEKMTVYQMMDAIGDNPGAFPGFWNGFQNGTWKKHFNGTLPEEKTEPESESEGASGKTKDTKDSDPIGNDEISSDDIDEKFNEFILKNIEKEHQPKVGDYVQEQANLGQCEIDNVMAWAIANQDDFKNGLLNFIKKAAKAESHPTKSDPVPDPNWDPYTSEVMKRYVPEKAAVLKIEADKWGIKIEGKLPREVHAEILNAKKKHDEEAAAVASEQEDQTESSDNDNEDDIPFGSDSEPENTESKSHSEDAVINYGEELKRIAIEDKDGLIAACDDMGYGKDIAIPLSDGARKKLYETYLKLKK